MDYVRLEYIRRDAAGIPEAVPFIVVRAKDQYWAYAMRIGHQFTLTRFQSQNVGEDAIRNVRKQILFCKKYGWSYTGFKSKNPEVDEDEAQFMCLYCRALTFDISKPCICRNTKIEDMMRKTPTGLILPI